MREIKLALLLGTLVAAMCLALGWMAFTSESPKAEGELMQLPKLVGLFTYENIGRYRQTRINDELIYCVGPAYIPFYADTSCGEFRRYDGKQSTAMRLSYPTILGRRAVVSHLTIDGVVLLDRTAGDVVSLWRQNSKFNIVGLSLFAGLCSAWIAIFFLGVTGRIR